MGTRYGPVKLRVPQGFPVLLQRFAREVLREQPVDIAKFGAEFFQHLHQQKLQTGEDPLIGDPFDVPFKDLSSKVLRPISSEVRQNEIKQELAATKIQAGYRGYHVRRTSRKKRDEEQQKKHKVAATKIQANYRGYRTRKSMKNRNQKDVDETYETNEESPNETYETKEETPEHQYGDDENNAALRIQANFRGYKTRKSLSHTKNDREEASPPESKDQDNEEEPIIDTSDPDMEAAALKIQASFRGHQTRKSLKNDQRMEDSPSPEIRDHEEEPIIDASDPDMEAAALKIQASFRGHQTRKSLKNDQKQVKTNEVSSDTEDTLLEEENEEFAHIEMKEQTADPHMEMDDEMVEETEDAEKVEDEVLVPEDEMYGKREKAAVRIQASYRGYSTRKSIQEKANTYESPKVEKDDQLAGGDADHKDEEKDDVETVEEQGNKEQNPDYEEDDKEVTTEVKVEDSTEDLVNKEAAAIRIQAQYRGYKTRKSMKTSGDAERSQIGNASPQYTAEEDD